jgi:hypothetical protein
MATDVINKGSSFFCWKIGFQISDTNGSRFGKSVRISDTTEFFTFLKTNGGVIFIQLFENNSKRLIKMVML